MTKKIETIEDSALDVVVGGGGGTTTVGSTSLTTNAGSTRTGDVNGDGRADIIVGAGTGGSAKVYKPFP